MLVVFLLRHKIHTGLRRGLHQIGGVQTPLHASTVAIGMYSTVAEIDSLKSIWVIFRERLVPAVVPV